MLAFSVVNDSKDLPYFGGFFYDGCLILDCTSFPHLLSPYKRTPFSHISVSRTSTPFWSQITDMYHLTVHMVYPPIHNDHNYLHFHLKWIIILRANKKCLYTYCIVLHTIWCIRILRNLPVKLKDIIRAIIVNKMRDLMMILQF